MVIFMDPEATEYQVKYVTDAISRFGYQYVAQLMGNGIKMISVDDTADKPADTVSFARMKGVGRVLYLHVNLPEAPTAV